MNSKGFTSELFQFENPRQERIYQNLVSFIGPGPASFYRDACHLKKLEPPLETSSHLIAHLFREIESGLRNVLEPIVEQEVPRKTNGKDAHKKGILAILKCLDISETDSVAQKWLNLAGSGEKKLQGRAHRCSLSAPRELDQDFNEFFDTMEIILDIIIQRLQTHYLTYFQLIDKLNMDKPTDKDIKILCNKIPQNTVAIGYFFNKLSSPNWLEALLQARFFKYPPKPDCDDTKGLIGFPSWPQSRYLARIAEKAPKEVLDCILSVPITENMRIHRDFAEAACKMPPESAGTWAKTECNWIKNQNYLYLLLPEKLFELVVYLAQSGQTEISLELSNSILEVLPDPRGSEESNKNDFWPPEPRSRFDIWCYKEILEKQVPSLITYAGKDALSLLCDLLEDAIQLSKRENDNDKQEDVSHGWKAKLECPCEREDSEDLRCLLASAVLNSADMLIETCGKDILRLLEGKSFKIFHRIGMHLRLKWPSLDSEGTKRIIFDPSIFNDDHMHYEVSQILGKIFKDFPPNVRKQYLELVANGVQPESWLEFKDREERDCYIRSRQYKKLWPVQKFLDTEWQNYFENLKNEFQELKDPDLPDSHISVKIIDGSSTPKDIKNLSSMCLTELIIFLKTWQPPQDYFGPSPAGLGNELKTLVASMPKIYAESAKEFKGLDPTYVRSVIAGLNRAIEINAVFSWEPVLDLCIWVLTQPRELHLNKNINSDHDWVWTRREIADLLSSGFKLRSSEIPFEFRKIAWEILEQLARDSDPTPEHEARYGGSNMDSVTLSINTVRGKSLHAVLNYAHWVHRHIKESCNDPSFIPHGFNEMPEVREILDQHLNPKNDPSLAIRSVYGRRLHSLISLDAEWTTHNLPNIFPKDVTLKAMRDIAWESYLSTNFSSGNLNLFDILINEYMSAIQLIGTTDKNRKHIINPDERLVEHLMVLYCNSQLDLCNSNNLISYFYEAAPDVLCGYAIEFLGRELFDKESRISDDVIIRLQNLWMIRTSKLKDSMSRDKRPTEPVTFGWWFISGRFDQIWTLEHLKKAIELAGKVEPDYLVLERLSEIATEMPLLAIECLEQIVKGEKENLQSIRIHSEEVRAILSASINSNDYKASSIAKDLINILASQNHLEYRDLIS